ncbi:unnamed protein product [Effrenium voratum]|uniref:Uncharacterized protein n=1 Tax=Effrenium voratum TaxID=2562239 RepID=A0AA36I2J1_9DINO|nr:unnamed protein product [Effrenium voratum]
MSWNDRVTVRSRSRDKGGGGGLRGWSDSEDEGKFQLKAPKNLVAASGWKQDSKDSKPAASQDIFLRPATSTVHLQPAPGLDEEEDSQGETKPRLKPRGRQLKAATAADLAHVRKEPRAEKEPEDKRREGKDEDGRKAREEKMEGDKGRSRRGHAEEDLHDERKENGRAKRRAPPAEEDRKDDRRDKKERKDDRKEDRKDDHRRTDRRDRR